MRTFLRIVSGPIVIAFLMLLSLAAGTSAGASSSQPLLPKSPLSGGVLMAQAIHSGRVKLAHNGAAATPAGGPIAKGVLPNVQVSPSSSPENETPIAADPTSTANLTAGANDYSCPNTTGFYPTTNGGKTWGKTCLGNVQGIAGCGDPVVGYDLTGAIYIGGLDCPPYGIVEKSTNHGQTFGSPVIAVTAIQPGGFVDKDWLQVDDNPSSPFKNNVYISTTQFNSGTTQSGIGVSHSSDGGATWTTVSVDPLQPTPFIDQFSDLAIAENGTVYVSWMRCSATGPTGDCGGTTATFYISKSTDGGSTWSTPTAIATASLAPDTCGDYYGTLPNTCERVSNIPVIAVDNSSGAHKGNIYATFYNWTGTFMQVEVTTSTNGGSTWGKPVPVAPSSDTHDQFFPWLTVSSTGIVGVTWMDRRNDPSNLSYEEFGAGSTTGGASFTTNVQLASQPSNPNNDGFGGLFIGDYTGNYWDGSTLAAAWTDTRTGVDQIFVGGYATR
jgi:hypothetical protein